MKEGILILIVGMLSGFMNTIGGGGSLLTLPVLIFAGLPSAVANGTNRIALMVQNLVAVNTFRNKGYFNPKFCIMLGAPAVLGSIIGAQMAVNISGNTFEKILGIVMLVVLVLIIWRPEKNLIKSIDIEDLSNIRKAVAVIAFFFVGFYGGFIQAGVGFIIILTLGLITGKSLVEINSLKVFIIGIYMLSSLVVFIANGKIDWILGIVLAIGNGIGAYIGSNFAVNKGDKWIRRIIFVAIMIMAAKLLGVHRVIF
ncbi:sulfite exporter TauE/SafE family protein [Sporosalibacterium faouarense]|uniref:sulfite exporter TauE/SafE family protein n=1 Tax=Sporosalibacterium faouarense TaxID=516123 RepID=UPI00141C7201|nr:sulfite exporter TauE/SafE family protein [Sporosalibacterium faouarense]MTI49342.1 sulfite exporter TauE/SafE family protein [Bacillota bacterium]